MAFCVENGIITVQPLSELLILFCRKILSKNFFHNGTNYDLFYPEFYIQ